ncbi:MAG: hypothetical protein WCA61_06610, partial [Nitrososphaeraceae archaeon]
FHCYLALSPIDAYNNLPSSQHKKPTIKLQSSQSTIQVISYNLEAVILHTCQEFRFNPERVQNDVRIMILEGKL